MNENQKNVIYYTLLTIESFFVNWGFSTNFNWIITISIIILGLISLILLFRWYFSKIFSLLIKSLVFSILILLFFSSITLLIYPRAVGFLNFSLSTRKYLLIVVLLISWSLIYDRISTFKNINFFRSYLRFNYKKMENWTASPTTNEQGTDYREIKLFGHQIERLSFAVEAKSDYWRAGFKLLSSNSSVIPLRNNNSLLFHIGSNLNEKNVGLSIYTNGNSFKHEANIEKDDRADIDISFEVNKKNFLKCFVNNSLSFNERIDPGILEKCYLLGWGDGHNYSVNFKNIEYRYRS